MKMAPANMNASNLDQWIRSTNTPSSNPVDHLSAFKKLTLNDRKFEWPSILTSNTSGFWLAPCNQNEVNQPASTWIRSHYEKIRKEDNKKWLMANETKNETDLVRLTDYNQWLCTPEEALPGKRTNNTKADLAPRPKSTEFANSNLDLWILQNDLPRPQSACSEDSQINKNLDQWIVSASNNQNLEFSSAKASVMYPKASTTLDNWLITSNSFKKKLDNDYNDWLIVPTNDNKVKIEKPKTIFQDWNEKSLHLSWTSATSATSTKSGSVKKVEEWLSEAFEEEIIDNDFNDDNDFDESSIEIIDC